ncbi:MAG: Bax inhibitor-1/YccA family protein [Alphaproteobacteria bacterium]|nr:Bax inhibitor-1/YccA family protein [Alphaproteobacteria bacterium]
MLRQKAQIHNINPQNNGGIDLYLKRIFALMFGAVGITAVAAYLTIWGGGLQYLINFHTGGMSALYYILLFGGLALSIWAQVRVFNMKPASAALLLVLYAVLIGVTMTPLIASALAVNPASILMAFIVAALMFACMALFGYKTVKDLSFLGIFLMMGMIGLILVGLLSFIWPGMMGGTFGTIVCFIGVLVFALFTAYDMQNLKRAYAVIGDEHQKNQLAVLGALHLYISFIAMFQYLLSLFNRE